MKIISILLTILCVATAGLFVACSGSQETAEPGIDYLGQTPPDSIPVIFAPGIVSINGRYEYGMAISPDGCEIFFTAEGPGDGLMVVRRVDGNWTDPEPAGLLNDSSWVFEAFYTVDGGKLHFAVISPGDRMPKLWSAEKNDTGWGDATRLDSPVNDDDLMWATFADDGTMYYSNLSRGGMYRSRLVDGKYAAIEKIDVEFGSHPFVAPDQSFVVFNGKDDIYVSFADSTGWTEPILLGGGVNSEFGETCPSLSPDGKYLFFSRYNEPEDKANIYWTDSRVIEQARESIQ